MRGNEFLDKMALIDPACIEAADRTPGRRKIHFKRWCAVAACLCLAVFLSIPAMTASVPAFYETLYAVAPAQAQFFKPVQLSCEDNGIRMEVSAAYIHEDTAEIHISMQDLEGTRIDASADLFDSYQIRTPFHCTGHCVLSGYEPETQTATFLVVLQQWNKQDITGDKLTFSVQRILSGKKTWQGIIEGVDLENAESAAVRTVSPRGLGGEAFAELYRNPAAEELTVLEPAGRLCSPLEGISLTGLGYIDGYLHVQIYYEDIRKTDNHGFLSLINRETGETLSCYGSVSFFDEAKEGSYVDYLFAAADVEALGEYALYGDFTASSGYIEGNWSVTFPLESTDNV